MQSKARLRGADISARKARLVADMVRGDHVGEAVEKLRYTNKKSAPILRKLIESAVSNAEDKADRAHEALDVDDLFITELRVDEGPSLRRWRPRAQGRATPIEKKTSHITVVLETR